MKCVTGDDGKRFYTTPEGNKYESVTSYLSRTFEKPWLIPWQKKVGIKKANEIKNAASKRGKSLHSLAEDYLLNKELNLDEDINIKILFLKIKPILNRISNIRLIEKSIYSDELELAGTPDIVADFDNIPSVLDVKSNSFANKKRVDLIDYMLQTACYSVMMKERFDIMPEQSVVIISSPNSPNGMVKIESMPMCISMLKNYRKSPTAFAKILAEARQGATKRRSYRVLLR